MLKRSLRRVWGAAAVTTALVIGTASAAMAVPTPDAGPVAGGTTVTIQAPEGPKFTSAFAGMLPAFGIEPGGNSVAWGSSYLGTLGDGTTGFHALPVDITTPDGGDFTFISGSQAHTLGLGADGKTYAWGDNSAGQLGNGSASAVLSPSPVEVIMPAGVTRFDQIFAGQFASFGIGDDGNTYSWGSNHDGQLGDGTFTDRYTADLVQTPPGVRFVQVSADSASYGGAMALGSDQQVYVWGGGQHGQLGNGTSGSLTRSAVPVAVPALTGIDFVQVRAGWGARFALAADGTLYAWGLNNNGGSLGDGTTLNRATPVIVTPPTPGVTFTEIISGQSSYAMYAMGSDGVLYGWGFGGFVGDGSTTNQLSPVPVHPPTGVVFSSYSTGYTMTLALEPNGTPWYWGAQVLDLTTPVAGSITPTPKKLFPVVVTGVTFDGLPGTDLTDNGDGTYDVVTPAHAAGPVDVVVDWTLNGVTQTPITYTDGFTYYAPATPTIGDPADVTVTEGDPAVFAVPAPTGAPTPTVTWQMFDGTSWLPVTGGTVSADGLTLTFATTALADSGKQFRAVATNSEGSDTSAPATLTVNPVSVTPIVTDPSDRTVKQGKTATFSVVTTGTPNPTVVWEVSRDGGLTWEAIFADPAATPSVDGLTLSVVGSTTNHGYLYRATASNSAGSVTSQAAQLTVTMPINPGGNDPKQSDEVNKRLSNTGTESTPLFWVAGAVALLLGGGLIAGNRIVTRRMKH